MKFPRIAASVPFAHLLGLQAAAVVAKGADEELEEDPEKKDARRAEDDDKKPDDGETAADGDEEDDADKDKKAKSKAKSKAKADDDGEDDADAEDDDGDEKEKAARRTERARCKAIFSCTAAGVRPDMAAHLAFNTNMKSKAAITTLEAVAAGTPRATGLESRMSSVALPNPGADGQQKKAENPAADAASMIINAGKKRRGES